MIGLLHRSSPHRTIGLITLTVAVLVGATVALVVHGTSASSSSLTAADRALLYQAEQTAIQNCLRDKGFRYWPEPQPSASVSNRFPYVIDDVAWARANGFGSRQVIQDRVTAARDPNVRYVAGLSPSRRAALGVAENGNGPSDPGVIATLPTGQVVGHSLLGCDATAEGYLYGSFPAWFEAENAVDSLPSLWQAQVIADPRYTAGVSRWAQCMVARNEPSSSPQAAADRFAIVGTAPGSGAAFSTEVSAAVAEARCAQSTGLGTLAAQLDAYYRSRIDAQYSGLLSTYHRMQQAALPRARSLTHIPASSGQSKEKG